jgi:hypothetical protein
MQKLVIATVVMVVLAISTTALGQVWVVASPIVADPVVVTSYYAPAPACPPAGCATCYEAPTCCPTTVCYPPTACYVARPVWAAPAVVPAPWVVGRPVIVHPKVYVPGQPVRNFFRAITP